MTTRFSNYFLIAFTLLIISCASEEQDLDKDLKFAINTSPYSRGLSSYRLPSSTDFRSIPQDRLNPITVEKVALGVQLFHESGFGTIGEFADHSQTYSCASCHHAGAGFQANMMQGIGDGGLGFGMSGEGRAADKFVAVGKIDVQPLRSPSVLNSAYQTNTLWNGQFGSTALNEGTESLWPDDTPIAINRLGYEGVEVQAIAGLAVHRHEFTEEAVIELGYKEMFDKAFASVPMERRYTSEMAGLALAAYERTVLANKSPFQLWINGDNAAMTEEEKMGALLFFQKGDCASCHNGPNLANMEFHAIGMNNFNPTDVINFKADDPSGLGRASFTKRTEDEYKFKVPQLYNLKDSPFYGHGASFTSVRDVIAYKNTAIAENTAVPNSQLSDAFVQLQLTEEEIDLLTVFVEDALYDADLFRYVPAQVASGACFPNNDWLSRADLNCN